MTAKLYNLNDHRKPIPRGHKKFLGLIGIAYENGNITESEAIKFEKDYIELTIAALEKAGKGTITFIKPPL